MRLLITGATGFVGSYLNRFSKGIYEVFGTRNRSIHPDCTNHNIFDVDITNKKSVDECIKKVQPDIIIHTAGIRNINLCELYPDIAVTNHFLGTKNVIDLVTGSGIRFIYLSSDSVFPGKKDFYGESDSPSPINEYGKAKLMAEEYIANKYSNYIIVRASLLFGWTFLNQDTNTVQDVVLQCGNLKTILLSTKNYNTPLHIKSATDIILKLIKSNYNGIVHMSGATRLSRYDLGVKTAETFNLDPDMVVPYDAPMINRPLNSCLSMNIIPELIQFQQRSLADELMTMKQIRGKFQHTNGPTDGSLSKKIS